MTESSGTTAPLTGNPRPWLWFVVAGALLAGGGLLYDLQATHGPCDVPASFMTLPVVHCWPAWGR